MRFAFSGFDSLSWLSKTALGVLASHFVIQTPFMHPYRHREKKPVMATRFFPVIASVSEAISLGSCCHSEERSDDAIS